MGRLWRGLRARRQSSQPLHHDTRDRRATGPRDEAGAVLILAMIFLVAISLIVGGLMGFVGTSLTATTTFASERAQETAATSAVNLAIENSRTTFSSAMLNAMGPDGFNPPAPCWGTGSPSTFTSGSVTVYVWCSMVWQPYSAQTRTITYSACLSTTTIDPAACAAAPLLQAVETFDDYPPGVGVPTQNPVPCGGTGFCGQSVTQDSWLWSPTVPSVTSISPTAALVNGNSQSTGQPVTVTVTGNGFVNGSSVNLVQETGPSPGPGVTPTTPNVPTNVNDGAGVITSVPASQITWSGCAGANETNCSLTFAAPAATSGIDYFVQVAAPEGSSAFVPTLNSVNTDDLQYSPITPVVTGISGANCTGSAPSGSITGGNLICLTGSGFYSAPNFAAQVWLWQSGVSVAASEVSVVNGTTITAVTPAVPTAGNWYAQVDTLGGNSSSTSAIFSYGVQVPIILGLSPSSGTTGQTLTITGGNFLAGSTVGFCLATNGNYDGNCPNNTDNTQISATVQSTTAPTTIKVTIPSMAAGTYYPIVTLPSPYNQNLSTYPPSQPYNEPADIFTHQ
jgi:hypothetical protein